MPGKIGILLSGLGFENGTEILELPFIYREIERRGAIPVCLIPTDLTPEPGRGKRYKPRDLFEELAPVIRGEALPIDRIEAKDLQAFIIPGGRGPIENLSNINSAGIDGKIVREVHNLIIGMHVRKKAIGTIGYGGALVIVALKRTESEPIIAIGEDAMLAARLSNLGVTPVHVGPQEVLFDPANVIFSANGLTLDTSLMKASEGIERLLEAVIEYTPKKD